MKVEMQEASNNLNFEKAGEIRDKMMSIQNLLQKQKKVETRKQGKQ